MPWESSAWKIARAGAAAPASQRSRASASVSGGSKSWRTTPKGNSRSSSLPRAVSTRISSSQRGAPQLREQPALPDPRRTLHKSEPAAPAQGVGKRGPERLDLAVSLEEKLSWASATHRSTAS